MTMAGMDRTVMPPGRAQSTPVLLDEVLDGNLIVYFSGQTAARQDVGSSAMKLKIVSVMVTLEQRQHDVGEDLPPLAPWYRAASTRDSGSDIVLAAMKIPVGW